MGFIDGRRVLDAFRQGTQHTVLDQRVAYRFDAESDALVIHIAVRKTENRDVTALQASYAALDYYRVEDIHIEVGGGTESEVRGCMTVIRDAGRTELEPGTVTAGVV